MPFDARHIVGWLGQDDPPGGVMADELLLLYTLARASRSRTILEFGVLNVDFVLIDSCHHVGCYAALWSALEPCLSEDAVVVLHDTGLHDHCPTANCGRTMPRRRVVRTDSGMQWKPVPARYVRVCDPGGCGFVNRPGNREMVNRLNAGGRWQAQPLHTTRVYRHGVSLVTRRGRPAFAAPPRRLPATCRAREQHTLN
eukprot:gene3553-55294_t